MAAIKRFEEIEAWKKARELSKEAYHITRTGKCVKEFGFINQIRDSSGSAMDNIAEGFERGGNKEFIQFLSFAKGSAGEVKSQLYRALDQEYISKEKFEDLYNIANQVSKLVGGLTNYLSKSEYKRTQISQRTYNPITLNIEL